MQLNDDPISYYETLELMNHATPQEIRSAYLRLKASYGKENVANYSIYTKEETEQLVQQIEEAYLVLSNPEKRALYDASIMGEGTFTFQPQPTYATTPLAETPKPSHHITPQNAFLSNLDESFIQELDWTGADLRRARESRRVNIEDLADYTRISKNYILAIEEENYDKLPATVYVRGFLQQISKRLKLPVETVIKKYIARMKSIKGA